MNKDVISAIQAFLDYGERECGKSHGGYFSGGGFAARTLREYLNNLKKEEIK